MAYDYKLVSVNDSTAVKKAKSAVKTAQKAFQAADEKSTKANSTVKKLQKTPKNETTTAKNKRLAKLAKAKKAKIAAKKNYERKNKALKKAKDKLSNFTKQSNYEDNVSQQLDAHNDDWKNEGNCAIYPTNAGEDGSQVIYILPSDSESESDSSNVTSWPVDEGTPRSSYARMASRTITIEGILTGENGDNAHDKYVALRKWNQNHVELTYHGDLYYTHLIITGLTRDFTDLADNLHVSITFAYVQAAEVTTTSKKSSKSSKTKAGNRSKKYTALTIKAGDTLSALAKKYGKSVKWLAKVNKIKNPNKIIAGKKIRVK